MQKWLCFFKITFLLFIISKPIFSAASKSCVKVIQNLTPMSVEKNTPIWDEAHLSQYEEAFTVCLSEYIQIQTINPPGSEARAVEFLKQVFEALQIPTKEWTFEGRSNLVATLLPVSGVSKGTDTSMILYHHTDVVPVFPEQWTNPKDTFSGAIHDGFIWGRGALDMKSTGVMQLLAMAIIKINKIEIQKAIHYIAAADEEVGAAGATGMLSEMKVGGVLEELMGADALLNEGGYGVSRNKKDVYLIGTEEKGGAWLKVQHTNPKTLLKHIDETFAIFEENKTCIKKTDFAQCTLDTFETHGSQINVLPSKVSLHLVCPKNVLRSEVEFRKIFTDDLAKTKNADIKIKNVISGFDIQIELPSSAHGALEGTSALSIAARGLQNVGILEGRAKTFVKPNFYRYLKTPAITDLIKNISTVYSVPSWVVAGLSYNKKLEQVALKEMGKAIFSERLFRTSCSWTGFNLKQGQAEALVDCRLLHTGQYANPELPQAEAFVNEINQRAQDKALKIDIIKGWQYAKTTSQSRDYEIIKEEVLRENSKAIVTGFLTPTGSDNAWFRAPISLGFNQRPIPSYGFLPSILNDGLTGTIHGSNERFPLSQIRPSLKIYSNIVRIMADVVSNRK